MVGHQQEQERAMVEEQAVHQQEQRVLQGLVLEKGLQAWAQGLVPDGVGMGAGVPSLGLIFGAKGERVTRNFGPPSPGLTGAPSLGVSFKVGLGGVGNPS